MKLKLLIRFLTMTIFLFELSAIARTNVQQAQTTLDNLNRDLNQLRAVLQPEANRLLFAGGGGSGITPASSQALRRLLDESPRTVRVTFQRTAEQLRTEAMADSVRELRELYDTITDLEFRHRTLPSPENARALQAARVTRGLERQRYEALRQNRIEFKPEAYEIYYDTAKPDHISQIMEKVHGEVNNGVKVETLSEGHEKALREQMARVRSAQVKLTDAKLRRGRHIRGGIYALVLTGGAITAAVLSEYAHSEESPAPAVQAATPSGLIVPPSIAVETAE